MAQKFNLFIDQGSSFKAILTVFDLQNNKFDITDWEFESQIRKLYTSNTEIVSFTITKNESFIDGKFELSLTAAETAELPPGSYVYDVLMIDDTNEITYRIIEGSVTVKPSVTKL